MVNHRVSPERLQSILSYDSTLGIIKTDRQRRVLPDESGLVTIWDKDLKTRRKMLYKNLAWILGNSREVPEGAKVLCLNLNEEDVSLRNLKIVEASAYRDIKIALRNLNGVLRIAQHPEDKHAYHVIWSEYKKECRVVHYDIGAAEKYKKQKEKEFVKFINEYIVSK